MNLTNFERVKMDVSKASYVGTSTELRVTFGNYARVTENIELYSGDFAQAKIGIVLPKSYPFGNRVWSERFITFDNYQQVAVRTTRVAVMCQRSGYISLVSNRGSGSDGFHLLDVSNVIPPLGEEFEVMMQVYFSDRQGLIVAYLNGVEVLRSIAPNIDKGNVMGRCRPGIDGAAGASGQTAIFTHMETAYLEKL